MVEGKRVAVVIPAYNEETLVGVTVAGIPEYVDRIYVVDDCSTDGTVAAVRQLADPRLELIAREKNGGVGAAIVSGYKRAIEERIDVTAVMAADNQMPPADLITLVTPVALGEVDYTKANRLFTGRAWDEIPHYRYLGNATLSMLTKIASGYWHIADSQSGFTAISLDALEKIDLDRIYPRYGMPNDLLVHLNVWNARVRDVPSKPVYGVGEKSRDPPAQGGADDLLAAAEGVLLADEGEVRDPRLPSARLLLHPRDRDARDRARPRHRRDDPPLQRLRDPTGHGDAGRAARRLGPSVHAVRDVVRHGIEQGSALDANKPEAECPLRFC